MGMLGKVNSKLPKWGCVELGGMVEWMHVLHWEFAWQVCLLFNSQYVVMSSNFVEGDDTFVLVWEVNDTSEHMMDIGCGCL